jgi:site-specific DNA recombinase
VTDRQTGKKKVIHLPTSEWIWRDVPHLRILSDELAEAVKRKLGLGAESFGRKAKDRRKTAHRVDLYPKVLIRPVCGCCGNPMILGRSVGKYQSFFCFNANSGINGCTNRGYKSARIIDEAVLGTVMATLFTDDFLADLTVDVNKRLAWITRQPIPSTKKLEREIANEDRQLKRLTDRLAKLDDTHLDAVLAKAEEMGRQLAAKREQLKELQRASRRPNVKSVKEKDVVAALGKLRDLLQGDVGVAAQVLKALVGDVVIQKQHVDGYENPQMVARFTINAIPAMAILGRISGASDGDSVWPHLQSAHPAKADRPSLGGDVTVTLAYKPGGSQRRTEDDGV